MILLECQYIDQSGSLYNGGWCQHFYDLGEAIACAVSISQTKPGTPSEPNSGAICTVYADGMNVGRWYLGRPI